MKKIIELTDSIKKRKIYVNVDKILYFYSSEDPAYTIIKLDNGEELTITGGIYYLTKLIKKAK